MITLLFYNGTIKIFYGILFAVTDVLIDILHIIHNVFGWKLNVHYTIISYFLLMVLILRVELRVFWTHVYGSIKIIWIPTKVFKFNIADRW